jgi:carnitine O-acetyltransferase
MTTNDPSDGFFDAGMLLHALKGVHVGRERAAEKPPRRQPVGKKLQIAEY